MLTSHSIAGADDVDPFSQGLPFDSTPSIFDTQFFVETQLTGNQLPDDSSNPGEEQAPLPGELRLLSDHLLARDSATNCLWQANVNNQAHMASTFEAAFAKLQVTGQDVSKMVDCSDVIPAPPPIPAANARSFFPPGQKQSDIQQACATAAFPSLTVNPGASPTAPNMCVLPLWLALAPLTVLSFQDPATDGNCNDDGSGCIMQGFQASS